MKSTKLLVQSMVMLLVISSMLWQTCTVSAASDTQAPTVPKGLTVTGKTHTTITLGWAGSSDNIKVKGYQLYRDGKKITTTTKTVYTNKSLIPGRNYTYTVKAYDEAGNLSESSNTVIATTLSDLQSPSTPKSLRATAATFNTISIAWEPSADDVGIKDYEIYCNGKKIASPAATYYECKRLKPGTSYTFYIKACDKAGNYSAESNRISAGTTPDNAAPSIPAELRTSSVTVTEVNLAWQPALDNVKVKGYDILRDGVKIATTSKTSYCNKNLTPGKNYAYSVRASDTSGNISKSSKALNVTTLKDSQPPAAPTKLRVTDIKGSNIYLEWTASTDNAKVTGYQIYCNGIVIATAARTSRVVKSPFGLGVDMYWIKAYDQSGNLSPSSNIISAVTFSK